jgi:hypothetical protein
MKIKDFEKLSRPRVLRNLVAFKWLKPEKFSGTDFFVPDNIHDGGGEGRLGHRYTCEALAIGPEVKQIKPGDKFILHEYDKVDQGTPWVEDEVLFVEERVVKVLYTGEGNIFGGAKEITQDMMDKFEDY